MSLAQCRIGRARGLARRWPHQPGPVTSQPRGREVAGLASTAGTVVSTVVSTAAGGAVGTAAGDPGKSVGSVLRHLPASRAGRLAGAVRRPRGASLNWSLRRYVRASPPRVWLIRQRTAAGGPTFRGDPRRARGGRPGATGNPGWPAPGRAVAGGSRPPGRGSRRAIWRSLQASWRSLNGNGQMEHSTQVAAGLRGDVRPGEAIAPRDSAGPPDLGLTTFGDEVNLKSNIFGFVMT